MKEIEDLEHDVAALGLVINEQRDKFKKLQDKLESIKKKEKPWEWWLPKDDEYFYYLDVEGGYDTWKWCNSKYHNHIRRSNNVFKTKQDAELFAPLNKWQRAVAWVLRELNGGWLPDWLSRNQEKWLLKYDHDEKSIVIKKAWTQQNLHDLLHGKSEEIMAKCREILGDEIIEKSCGYFRETKCLKQEE